jgi:transaldolase/glucose-6-phosphate isomerase
LFLVGQHRDVLDVGTYNGDPIDYPDCAEAVGAALRHDRAERGIIVCGSGVGASMAANRIPGIRAAMCHDTYSAHQGVEHDDMNVLVLGGRVVGVELAREVVGAFLNAHFSGDPRYLRRVAKMTALENPVRALQVFGQSVWLDYLRRSLISGGELRRLIDEDGLSGVTSNPAILEKAIAGSSDYKHLFQNPQTRALDVKALYETLVIEDVRQTADTLRPVFTGTARRDGYVSLEVSPTLAYDTEGTLDEARRLWHSVGRENLMIKIPATPQGITAIHVLICEGINVNATLLFSQRAYEQVAEAYISGLERRAAAGASLTSVASVASFFVSRIDTAIDAIVEARLETANNPNDRAALRALTGKVAIANARLAYQRYRGLFSGPRWQALATAGAQAQRLVWASTGTKNPGYRDVLYVEELIGPDTVNAIPPATLDSFRDHGRPRASLTEDVDSARDTMAAAADLGININDVADSLLAEGVQIVAQAFERLLLAIERERTSGSAHRINRLTHKLPRALAVAVNNSLDEWRSQNNVRRLWARDASLWTGKDEGQWLGWLGITNDQLAHIHRLNRVQDAAKTAGFSHVLLLGMGGSSLGPEVIRATFEPVPGFPKLHVLDSTDPAQVRAFESRIDLERTLFVVSSKSGSTLEPNIFKAYFFERVEQRVGRKNAGSRFIAITDPDSWMQQVAERDGFRHVFLGWPDIGGRYSVLSDFGLVPAAIIGVDVQKFLNRTEEMVCACMPSVPVEDNPGVLLGTILGVAAGRFGRNKLTFVPTARLAHLGAWLEQLVAESTGKDDSGIITVDREPLGKPQVYGRDRIFVHLTLASIRDAALEKMLEALERADHPVIRITLNDAYDLGQQFFLWEFATAVAGSILGIHPFDQPDVEASKIATRRLTDEYEASGTLPTETPIFVGSGLSLFADEKNASTLGALNQPCRLEDFLANHLGRLGPGDYFAMLAYLEMIEAHEQILQGMRHAIRDAKRVATCLQFGPRFLHSTGQAYKGGPNSGVFLQITCDDAVDVPVPGRKYTLGIVKAAQARGDFEVLAERGRRVLRVHLGPDVVAGLHTLHHAVLSALRR